MALAEMMAWTIDEINADEEILPGITLGWFKICNETTIHIPHDILAGEILIL